MIGDDGGLFASQLCRARLVTPNGSPMTIGSDKNNLLNATQMLASACHMLETRCIRGIRANREQCQRHVDSSIGVITALVPHIGYGNATRIASTALMSGSTVRELVVAEGLLDNAQLDALLSPSSMLAPRTAA